MMINTYQYAVLQDTSNAARISDGRFNLCQSERLSSMASSGQLRTKHTLVVLCMWYFFFLQLISIVWHRLCFFTFTELKTLLSVFVCFSYKLLLKTLQLKSAVTVRMTLATKYYKNSKQKNC